MVIKIEKKIYLLCLNKPNNIILKMEKISNLPLGINETKYIK